MQTIALSEAALAILRLHVERDNFRIDDSNRDAHRELAGAGLMEAIHTFEGTETMQTLIVGRAITGIGAFT